MPVQTSRQKSVRPDHFLSGRTGYKLTCIDRVRRAGPAPQREFPLHEPTHPDPSQEGSRQSSTRREFPSWEGFGVGSWSKCMRKCERRLSMNQPAQREVLECASPLALSDLVRERKSGRGLPQSKTLARQRPPRRGSWSQCLREGERRLSIIEGEMRAT